MLKIYLSSVIIYFIIFIAEGLAFRKIFLKSQEKINKSQNIETKRDSYLKTTIDYLIISFIPVIRLISFITKLFMTFYPDKCIEIFKEKEKENE